MPGNPGRQIQIQKGDQAGHKIRGAFLAPQKRHLVLLCELQHFCKIGQLPGDDQRRQLLCKQHLQPVTSGLFVNGGQVRELHLPDDLDPLRIKVFIKPHQLQTGTIYIIFLDLNVLGFLVNINGFQFEFVDDLLQAHFKLICHNDPLLLLALPTEQNRRMYIIPDYIILHSPG